MPQLLRSQFTLLTDEVSDEALVAATLIDPQAFSGLYTRYLSPVYRYCYGRLGNREEAEDATSLVFTRVLVALPTYRGGSFRSWLFAIAHNVVLNNWRDRRSTESLELAPDIADGAAALDDLAEESERRHSVQRVLASLSEEQRHVLELRLAGLTGPEIAAALGRSHGAVRTTQCRALTQLRRLLGVTSPAKEGRNGS